MSETSPVPAEPVEHADPAVGHADVDAVLATLDGLDDRPVAEHVAVFETAHERLRSVLTGAGEQPGS